MSILKEVEQKLLVAFRGAEIPLTEVKLLRSNRPDLGDYQLNDAMKLAKVMHKNPHEIALTMVSVLEDSGYFSSVSIAGVGFINLTFKDEFLLSAMNRFFADPASSYDLVSKRKVFLDYGGANIAKTLHVGHLRPANIGESLKRLARHLGCDVISDVHFGDIGRQSGMVIYEIRERYPNLNYFSGKEEKEWDPLPITAKDLEEIYPVASTKAKENEKIMEEVRRITAELEALKAGYVALWDKIKQISIADIKSVYQRLHTDFDLWEGESDCYPYIPPMLERLQKEGYLVDSEGAKVIEVKEDTDTAPMPSLVVVKNDGATLYATRELATLDSRMKRFSPDEIWYVVDVRQELYFTQVFRAAYKTKIVPSSTKLLFLGFGTMNGSDGKPFKTRDGNAMSLKTLLDSVKEEIKTHMREEITGKERDDIAEKIMIAAVKYADILPNRTTDYIFEPSKFIDVDGKTGPYLLYATIRMKSLLAKAKKHSLSYQKMYEVEEEKEIILLLLQKAEVLTKAFELKELNIIAEYLYQLTSAYNRFYEKHYILREENQKRQESWLVLTKMVYDTNVELLTILGIEIPEKM